MSGPAISVCIPAYAMQGRGGVFLSQALASIAAQDFTDVEVIVGDQDDTGAVAAACLALSDRLAIRRIANTAPRLASANANVAMDAARGRWIKLLFQDDRMHDPGALSRIADACASGAGWVATGCVHDRGGRLMRPHRPHWHGAIRFGRNTIGAPSVVTVPAAAGLRFDEGLRWLMDVEFYHRAALALGPPFLLPEAGAVIGLHEAQVTGTVSRTLARAELEHVASRHPPRTPRERLALWQRRLNPV